VSIIDNDTIEDTPKLFVRDATVDESAGTATFTVLLGGPSGAASNSVVTVDNGSDSALFRFEAANANAAVSASELTQLASLTGTAAIAAGDVSFVGAAALAAPSLPWFGGGFEPDARPQPWFGAGITDLGAWTPNDGPRMGIDPVTRAGRREQG
jgi:hypothetical protein